MTVRLDLAQPAAAGPAVIVAEGLCVKAGGRWVLDTISLTVRAGQVVAVTGPNGCGKSLLAGALVGTVPVSAGRVSIGGLPVGQRKARLMLGYLAQSPGHYDYLSVEENLRFFAAAHGVGLRRRRQVCADLLELVGLAGLARHDASDLTPGQRQRLAIARALVGEPKALVLDEPFTGLDAEGQTDLAALLRDLADMGRAVLVTAGYLDSLACDRRFVLSEGHLSGGDAA